MDGGIDIAHLEKSIRSRVKNKWKKASVSIILNEQMKAIPKEIG